MPRAPKTWRSRTTTGWPPATSIAATTRPPRPVVRALIEEVGFEPIDVGPLTSARYLEPMTVLWITASRSLGRQFAFKVLR